MPRRELTDLIVALLHHVASPHHRDRRGGRCHRWPTPAPPQPPMTSATPNPRVFEWPPSPSPERLSYRPMEPSDHDASPRGRHGHPCVIHGWARALTRLHWRLGLHHRATRGRRRDKKKKNYDRSRSSPALYKSH
jgi:hypothetical protein